MSKKLDWRNTAKRPIPRGLAVWLWSILTICRLHASNDNVVLEWNKAMIEAVKGDTNSPCLAVRNLAILHIAIADTFATSGADRTPENTPICVNERAPMELNPVAAANSAAYTIANTLYPSHWSRWNALRERLDEEQAERPVFEPARDWGRKVAIAVLSSREKDGASQMISYIPHTEAGAWRRTLPFFRPPELPHWGRVTPFVVTECANLIKAVPPKLESSDYAAAFNEIKSMGAANSTTRTHEQTLIARFWSDFSFTSTPPGHWNGIARHIALTKELKPAECARLFALLNAAMADTSIAVWERKYQCNAWRPVTAVREAARDGNESTAPDENWTPLLNTPPHPEFVSGHSAFSSAAAIILARYFATEELSFKASSDSLPGVERSFSSLSAAVSEIGLSRIYGGIHFRFSVEEGERCGKCIATQVWNRLHAQK